MGSEWGRQQRVKADIFFSFLFYTSGEKPLGIEGQRSTLPGEETGPTLKLSAERGIKAGTESLPLSRLLPPFQSPASSSPMPVGQGWQGVWGNRGGEGSESL